MSKILVIEDQDDIRSIICEILTAENFNVIEAEDGHIGVLLGREESPNLVICDVMMPEFDGYSVMTQLRQYPYLQAVPFIFLTAKASKADRLLGMDLGANDYLTKPFTRDELLGAVKAQIKQQMVGDQAQQNPGHDICCDLIQSLPLEIHTPLQNMLDLASPSIEEGHSSSATSLVTVLDEIHHSGKVLYQRLQNVLVYRELAEVERDPQRLRILRSYPGESATKEIIEEISLAQSGYCNRTTNLQLELTEARVQLAQPKLKKLVEEVVKNAFNYSAFGTPISLVSSCRGNTFLLKITNHGPGLQPEQIASLGSHMQFNHAFYLHQYTGLGLIIAKLLAELHSGELQVESIPDQLTTISIFLPLMTGA